MGRTNKREKYRSERDHLRRKIRYFLNDIKNWQKFNPEALKGKESYKLKVIKEKLESLQIEVQGYYILKVGEIEKKINVDQERKDYKNRYLEVKVF